MKFEIWSEGYIVTGGRGRAVFHGDWEGETFADACQSWADSLPPESRSSYKNVDQPRFWSCRLFDNEADARKAYG